MAINQEIASLSVTLALDSGKFQKSISAINSEIKNLDKDFKNAGKGVSNFENTFNGLSQKMSTATQKMDLYNKKLTVQKTEHEKLQSTIDKQVKKLNEIEQTLGKTSPEWQKQAELVQKNSQKLGKLGSDIKSTEGEMSKLSRELKTSQESFDKLTNKTQTYDQKLAAINRTSQLAQSQFNLMDSKLAQLGSSSQKFANELNKQKNATDTARATLDVYNGEIAKLNDTITKSQAKHSELGGAITKTENELVQAKAKFGENSTEVQKLEQKLVGLKSEFYNSEAGIQAAENKLHGFKVEANNTEAELIRLDSRLRSMPLQNLSHQITAVGDSMKHMGQTMSIGVTAPIVGAFTASVHSAAEFQHEMADVRKEVAAQIPNTKELNQVMSDMGKNSLQWSQDYGVSTGDINEGLLTLVKDGYSAKEAMDVMRTSLDTSRGANEKLSVVVDQMGSSLEAYGMKAKDAATTTKNMQHMSDTFAFVANHTKASITSLGSAFSTVGSTAHALGIPMEQTATAIGVLESNGVDANTAATSLKAGLVNLTKPTKKMKEAMADMGFSAFDAKGKMKDLPTILNEMEKGTKGWTDQQKNAAIATITGKESLSSWNILLHKGGDYLGQLSDRAKNANGETKKLSAQMANTPVNQFKKLKETLHTVGVTFGTEILPAILPVVQKLQELVNWFAHLSEGTKRTILVFAALAAALGPVLIIAGQMITSIGAIVGVFAKLSAAGGIWEVVSTAAAATTSALATAIDFLLGPIGLVLLGIAAAIAIGVLLYKNWDTIVAWSKKLGSAIASMWNGIAKWFESGWQKAKSLTNEGINAILGFFKKWGSTILVIVSGPIGWIVSFIYSHWNSIKSTTVSIWNGISKAISSVWDGIKSFISGAVNSVKSTISNVWNGLENILTHPFKAAQNAIDGIMGGVKGAINKVKGVFGASTSSINVSAQTGQIGATAEGVGVGSEMAVSASGGGLLGSISDFSSTLGSLDYSSGNYAASGTVAKYTPSSLADKKQNENNDLLRQLIGLIAQQHQQNQHKPVDVSVQLDGKTIAQASARYMNQAINDINYKNTRLGGSF